jgi:hypothetical protein
MKNRPLAFATVLLIALALIPAVGEAQTDRAVFVNGRLDLATAFGKDGAPGVNQLVRGDSPFDNIRLHLFADAVVHPRLFLFNQFLMDPSLRFGFESFLRSYLRYTVFKTARADLNVQAGKIPTPFGTFGARSYPDKSPLVGIPLMYHYFSSLRANQLPADNRDLLNHRGQGQADSLLTPFKGGGSTQRISGLPMIYDAGWDFGVEIVGSLWRMEYLVGVTQGTVGAPRFKGGDNNDGKQVVARVGFIPCTGLMIGVSYAQGPYLDAAVGDSIRARGAKVEDFRQKIVGMDAEYSIRRLKILGEFAVNRWETPNIRDGQGRRVDLPSYSGYIEGKYTFYPGLYGAIRYDRLTFGEIDDGTGTGGRKAWDYGIRVWEVGAGYHLTDGVIGKAVWQRYKSDRPGGSDEHFGAMQLVVSF